MPKELQKGGKRMLQAIGQPCPYCARIMVEGDLKLQPTRDHMNPRSRFGPKGRRAGRWLPVCSECNFNKKDLTLEEYLGYLVEKNTELVKQLDTNVERIRCLSYLIAIGLE